MNKKLNVLYGDAVDVWKVFTCPKCKKSIELLQEDVLNAANKRNNSVEIECLHCGELQVFDFNTQFCIEGYQKLPYRIVRKG